MSGPFPPSLLAELSRAARQGRDLAATGTYVRLERGVSTPQQLQEVLAALDGSVQQRVSSTNGSLSFEVPSVAFTQTTETVGLWHCDEGSGNTAADSSDNENDLALTDVSWDTGQFDDCLSFDGASSVGAATLTSTEPVRKFLFFAAWINPTSGPLFQWEDVLEVYIDSGNLCAQVESTTYTGPAITASEWQLAYVQFYAGKVFIGVGDIVWAFDHGDDTLTVPAWSVTLGKRDATYYDGLMDEVWLTADVVVQEDWGKRTYQAQAGSIMYCPFNRGSGTEEFHQDFFGPEITLATPTWQTGYIDYAIRFNGSSDYAYFAPGLAHTAEKLTIHLVVKFASLDACTLLDQASGINLAWDGTHIVAALQGASNPASQVGPLDIDVDTWYDIALVYDGATKAVWLNGNKTGEVASTGDVSIPATTIYIGRTVAGASYFEGDLDFLHICKAELKPANRPIPRFMLGEYGLTVADDWVLIGG